MIYVKGIKMRIIYDNGLMIDVPKKITKLIKSVIDKHIPITVGMKLKLCNEEHILAQPECNKVCLISLKSGNRWREPIKVKDPYSITDTEMRDIVGVCYSIMLEDKDEQIN